MNKYLFEEMTWGELIKREAYRFQDKLAAKLMRQENKTVNDMVAREYLQMFGYVKIMHEDNEEMVAEMRAAFGAGETVVNVLTGETYFL